MAVSCCGGVDSSWHDLLPRTTATTPWTTALPEPPSPRLLRLLLGSLYHPMPALMLVAAFVL